MDCSLYLYGIFPQPGPQDLKVQGLDQEPVLTHAVDSFVFLYSEAKQEQYLASRRNLLTHEKVLEEAMHQGYKTLLPLQFGLVIKDWSSITEQLITPYHEKLVALFKKLEGKREVSVKILWESNEELQALMQENQQLKSKRDSLEGKQLGMDEVIKIGQLIEKALEERKQSIIKSFREQLDSLAVEVVQNDPMMDSMIYNGAYLIPWESEPQFNQAIETLDEHFQGRLRIRYNDFTAPYHFAQLAD